MDLRSILGAPAAYRLFIRLIVGNFRTIYVNEYVRPRPGDWVMDIGCGPGDILEHLPEVHYVGIDISEEYIRAARARFGARGTFICKALKDMAVAEPGRYDRVMANGLLHHLNDEEAVELFRLARAALKPGGMLTTFDGCYVEAQSRLARYILRKDRGKHVRPAPAYVELAHQVFADVKASVRHNLLRLPYTHIIMQCSP